MKNQREKSKISKSATCMMKRCLIYLTKPLAYIFETVWAIGVSAMAAMASPLLIH